MHWAIFAILSAIIFAISNILEKFIIDKKIKNSLTLFISGSFVRIIIVAILAFFVPLSGISFSTILLSVLAGCLSGLTFIFLYQALVKEDVSRVVAIYHIFPIFVAILAFVFLAEKISWLKGIAILITVLGAILISFKKDKLSQKVKIKKVFFVVLGAVLAEAILEVIDKHVLTNINPWQLFIIGYTAEFTIALFIFTFFPKIRQETQQIFSRFHNFLPILGMHLIYFLASALFLFAALFGPITSVSVITTSQPLFVFILTLVLSLHFPHILEERLDRKTVLVKTISIILIVIGVLFIIIN
jgi:bacterial/archaeal transporter family protein